jgi:hypothetical protein
MPAKAVESTDMLSSRTLTIFTVLLIGVAAVFSVFLYRTGSDLHLIAAVASLIAAFISFEIRNDRRSYEDRVKRNRRHKSQNILVGYSSTSNHL